MVGSSSSHRVARLTDPGNPSLAYYSSMSSSLPEPIALPWPYHPTGLDALTTLGQRISFASHGMSQQHEHHRRQSLHHHRQSVPVLHPRMSAEEMPPRPREEPPVQRHKVYLLHCAKCDALLSDRGMRAVLLLKPDIVLFSSDAPPSNTAPMYCDAPANGEKAVERTCECLTQSLGCLCGSTVGYSIIAPCSRCTQSVARHSQRSSSSQPQPNNQPNNHRYVYHYGEVEASERRYVQGEPGVLARAVARLPTGAVRSSSPAHGSSDDERIQRASLQHDDGLLKPTLPRQVSAQAGVSPGQTLYWHMLRHDGERIEPVDPKLTWQGAPFVIGR
ncbi:uncharacterized protein L969DRAFT_546851 [Mixia osmundae IAM 14324]|uniref:uncharacterized protein n=1 Tax=Mixia osmundae (strain CBS 9802 / IAM 14324 / JCM 22182 / KY 12970) TaxID=764103 RepID=UPI0004A55828|nr:uncharacterized protein L969DRAFT_546851 [Mixia osmundae IAM 14324]KEI38567.1 hypothetical protein L969DRAFT_546851 [Mixia osmundae IAM 14324]